MTDYDAIRRSPYYAKPLTPNTETKTPDLPRKLHTFSPATRQKHAVRRTAAFERSLDTHPHRRHIKEAAERAGITVTGVWTPSRTLIISQLAFDGIAHEIHLIRCTSEKVNIFTQGKSLVGRTTFNKRTYRKVSAHVIIMDLEAIGVLKAYRFTSTEVAHILFSKERSSAKVDLCLSPYGHGKYRSYHLPWLFIRPTPPE